MAAGVAVGWDLSTSLYVGVCRDVNTRSSLGYAHVNFSNLVDAARALESLNFSPLNWWPIWIMFSNCDPSMRRSGAANIFIKNLDKAIDNEGLHDAFAAFGNILSCKIATDTNGQLKGYGFVQFDQEESALNAIEKLNGMLMNDKEADGKSKCFGFVNFENPDDAAEAVQELNGKKIDDKEWYVGKGQKKSEREQELRGRFEQNLKEVVDKFQGHNLYLKNLVDNIGDEELRELFSEFGTITSCKIKQDPNGVSRGSGFVAFSTAEEAARVITVTNTKIVGSKPLYVAVAQRKEERRARLQAQFSQMRPVAMAAPVAPRVPMYPSGGPGLGQQIFYGQAPPAIIPPQPGFGYQQQLVPGMRPGSAPMANFFMPYVQQGQQAQRPGGRRAGAGPVQQTQHPVPMFPQQMLPRGRVYRYPPGRNGPEGQIPGFAGGMSPVPYDMGGLAPRDVMPQSVPIGALASSLANASPDAQRLMLGENLYPLVDQLEHDHAAKVTGMLLEMDQTEVLHLLDTPEALRAKVGEAMEVLRTVTQQQQQQQQAGIPADQLASLSLNDGIVS